MRAEILDTARHLITGDRQADYGDARENFEAIARLWSAYLGTSVRASDVGALMTLFKLARHRTGNFKPDNYVDAAGYIALAGEVKEMEQ
jgi:hypothetical protein